MHGNEDNEKPKGRGCGKVEDSAWREHYLGACGREQEGESCGWLTLFIHLSVDTRVVCFWSDQH